MGIRGLGGFDIVHSINIRARPPDLENTYMELRRLFINEILISAAIIKLAFLRNTSQFLTNCANRGCQFEFFYFFLVFMKGI